MSLRSIKLQMRSRVLKAPNIIVDPLSDEKNVPLPSAAFSSSSSSSTSTATATLNLTINEMSNAENETVENIPSREELETDHPSTEPMVKSSSSMPPASGVDAVEVRNGQDHYISTAAAPPSNHTLINTPKFNVWSINVEQELQPPISQFANTEQAMELERMRMATDPLVVEFMALEKDVANVSLQLHSTETKSETPKEANTMDQLPPSIESARATSTILKHTTPVTSNATIVMEPETIKNGTSSMTANVHGTMDIDIVKKVKSLAQQWRAVETAGSYLPLVSNVYRWSDAHLATLLNMLLLDEPLTSHSTVQALNAFYGLEQSSCNQVRSLYRKLVTHTQSKTKSDRMITDNDKAAVSTGEVLQEPTTLFQASPTSSVQSSTRNASVATVTATLLEQDLINIQAVLRQWVTVDKNKGYLPIIDVSYWSSEQMIQLFDLLLAYTAENQPFQSSTLQALNALYGFSISTNAAILQRLDRLSNNAFSSTKVQDKNTDSVPRSTRSEITFKSETNATTTIGDILETLQQEETIAGIHQTQHQLLYNLVEPTAETLQMVHRHPLLKSTPRSDSTTIPTLPVSIAGTRSFVSASTTANITPQKYNWTSEQLATQLESPMIYSNVLTRKEGKVASTPFKSKDETVIKASIPNSNKTKSSGSVSLSQRQVENKVVTDVVRKLKLKESGKHSIDINSTDNEKQTTGPCFPISTTTSFTVLSVNITESHPVVVRTRPNHCSNTFSSILPSTTTQMEWKGDVLSVALHEIQQISIPLMHTEKADTSAASTLVSVTDADNKSLKNIESSFLVEVDTTATEDIPISKTNGASTMDEIAFLPATTMYTEESKIQLSSTDNNSEKTESTISNVLNKSLFAETHSTFSGQEPISIGNHTLKSASMEGEVVEASYAEKHVESDELIDTKTAGEKEQKITLVEASSVKEYHLAAGEEFVAEEHMNSVDVADLVKDTTIPTSLIGVGLPEQKSNISTIENDGQDTIVQKVVATKSHLTFPADPSFQHKFTIVKDSISTNELILSRTNDRSVPNVKLNTTSSIQTSKKVTRQAAISIESALEEVVPLLTMSDMSVDSSIESIVGPESMKPTFKGKEEKAKLSQPKLQVLYSDMAKKLSTNPVGVRAVSSVKSGVAATQTPTNINAANSKKATSGANGESVVTRFVPSLSAVVTKIDGNTKSKNKKRSKSKAVEMTEEEAKALDIEQSKQESLQTKQPSNVATLTTNPEAKLMSSPSPHPTATRVVILISKQSIQREVFTHQEKALTILTSKGIPFEVVDGSDQANKDTRNNLFQVSGLGATYYPQFFLVKNGEMSFWGDWEKFETSNENGLIEKDFAFRNTFIQVANSSENAVATAADQSSQSGSLKNESLSRAMAPVLTHEASNTRNEASSLVTTVASTSVVESGDRKTKTDITVYGATSFVAKHATDYFMQASLNITKDIKITLAGRNKNKILALQKRLTQKMSNLRTVHSNGTGKCIFDTFVADSSDAAGLKKMATRTKVVANFAGPYGRYGENVVAACAQTGADYVDITGEASWAGAMRLKYSEVAAKSCARIISFCGFDSIPSDLAVFAAVDGLKKKLGEVTVEQATTWHYIVGMANGGTLQTILDLKTDLLHNLRQPVPFLLDDPLILAYPRLRVDPLMQETKNRLAKAEWLNLLPSMDPILWLGFSAPFFMAPVNAKVVHASAIALNYGKNFTYRERVLPVGYTMARKMALFSLVPVLILQLSILFGYLILKLPIIGRALLNYFLPPGTGSSDIACKMGVADVYSEVTSSEQSAPGLVNRANCFMKFQGDPGNWVTAQCICESALALLLDKDTLPVRSQDGFGTPAELLGSVLIKRLKENAVRPVEIYVNVRTDVPRKESVVYDFPTTRN